MVSPAGPLFVLHIDSAIGTHRNNQDVDLRHFQGLYETKSVIAEDERELMEVYL